MESARQREMELDAPSVPWSTLGVERAACDSSSPSEKQKPKQDLNKRNTNRHADMEEGSDWTPTLDKKNNNYRQLRDAKWKN